MSSGLPASIRRPRWKLPWLRRGRSHDREPCPIATTSSRCTSRRSRHLPDRLSTSVGKRSSTCACMVDNELTAAADYGPGDRVRLSLESWANVAPELDGISRGELSDPELLQALPWWGTPVEVESRAVAEERVGRRGVGAAVVRPEDPSSCSGGTNAGPTPGHRTPGLRAIRGSCGRRGRRPHASDEDGDNAHGSRPCRAATCSERLQ